MADNFFGDTGTIDPTPEETPSEDTDTPFLKPGMNATVEIAATNKRNILVLPNEAILSFGNRKMVRVIGEDGQPGRPQPIEAGVSSFRQNRNHLRLRRRASRRRGRFRAQRRRGHGAIQTYDGKSGFYNETDAAERRRWWKRGPVINKGGNHIDGNA